tara:strand:+ start:3145 stop:5265 length:2121 start_codon:yes stop_codon:yes gene_type:complete
MADNTEDIVKRLIALEEERSTSTEDRLKKLGAEIDLVNELKDQGSLLLGQDLKSLEYKQDALELQARMEKFLKNRLNMTTEEQEKELNILDTIKQQNAARDQSKSTADGLLKTIFGMSEASKQFGNQLLNPAAAMQGMKDALEAFGDPAKLLGAVALNTIQLSLAQDQAAVSFNRATGNAGEFGIAIAGLERELFTAGVDAAEAGQAFQSLFTNVSEFTEMSRSQQKVLAETVAILNELGVSSELAARNIEFSTKAMGMSARGAARLQRELFTFAQDLGVSAEKIAQDFGQFGNEIAALGKNGVNAFRDLEVAAKSLGMEMSELLQLTKQFDRFDTAAESVGRLNALLGGPFLNAVQMVSVTDPTERLRLLKQGIDRAGISFDQMDYFQRKALASATGLGEAQLAMLMRGDIDLVASPMKTAKELAELEKQTAHFNSLMDELRQIGMGLALSLQPIVTVLKHIAQAIQFVAPLLGPAALGFALVTATKAVYGLATSFKVLNVAMLKNPIGMIAQLFGYLAIGLVIGHSPPVIGSVLGLAAAFLFLGPIITGMIPGLLVMVGVFGAIALAVTGLTSVFAMVFNDDLTSNLQIMASEIASIVDKINELETAKAVAFSTSVESTAVSANALAQTGASTAAAIPAAAATTPATSAGPPPTINISLSVDGTEFQTAVNSVEVTNYVNGQKSTLFDSIANAFINNQVTTRGN